MSHPTPVEGLGIYIYIYIEREREKERKREIDRVLPINKYTVPNSYKKLIEVEIDFLF